MPRAWSGSYLLSRGNGRVLEDEYLDLYILAATALVFAILGVTGIASVTDLASMILALLTVLALSQVRSRRQIAAIASAQRADPFSMFAAEFPADLIEQRASAADLLLIGITMSRTVQGSSREDMRQTLLHGGRIRVLLLDPADDSLLGQALSRHRGTLTVQRLRSRIQATLDELASLQPTAEGTLEIRVSASVPSMGVNAVNPDSPQGVLVVQHYQHKPPIEASPIIRLKAADGPCRHFLAEAERMWHDASPWPPSAGHALIRAPRPAFLEAFGAEVDLSMSNATDLLITGVARNTLLTSRYSDFQEWLRRGCRIRFLLLDPASDHAVTSAAERYHVERSPGTLRGRISHALRLLEELQRSTHGDLSVRLTPHPLALGIIAVNSTPALQSETSAIFAEYYTYQAPGASRNSSSCPPTAAGTTTSSAKLRHFGPTPQNTPSKGSTDTRLPLGTSDYDSHTDRYRQDTARGNRRSGRFLSVGCLPSRARIRRGSAVVRARVQGARPLGCTCPSRDPPGLVLGCAAR